ncbi:hypothetical protein F4804DRAFT_337040 [Jackrogersella minutella]|nr:hypothetical protein F4804DRAFT_337040 [Jackrogersella minutella]
MDKNGKPSIQLMPTTEDHFPLSDDPVTLSSVEQLFTFNSCEADAKVQEDETPLTTNTQIAFSAANSSDEDDVNLWPCERTIVLPGHPAYIQGLRRGSRQFTVSRINGLDRPEFSFEKLCRAAIEEGQLDSIKSAAFVTDTDTLWALFSTLHAQVLGRRFNKHMKGIVLSLHSAGNTVFMKVLNRHVADKECVNFGMAHLKENGLQWCNDVETDDHSSEAQELNSFKRVISYNFGQLKMVVEDGHQILSARPGCHHLDGGDPNDQDGLG